MNEPPAVGRRDLGYLLAKATQRWNELLAERFAAAGYGDIRPSYGSVLLPLFEEDGLRLGELARRSRLSKQTMTELVRRLERGGLVERRADPSDGRASLVYLTSRARTFEPIAADVLAELDVLVRGDLGDERVDTLKAALTDLVGDD
ncbi:MAG: MarR family winged helix-turn-helix transcriptional regulator [Gaiellaceae bacterium]